jgi:hypothetical protein
VSLSGTNEELLSSSVPSVGLVFVLPNQLQSGGGVGEGDSGDIVLAPQQLADVFKCVITCNSETTRRASNQQLFEDGILVHNRVGFVWSEFEAGPGGVGVRDVRLEGRVVGSLVGSLSSPRPRARLESARGRRGEGSLAECVGESNGIVIAIECGWKA